ncbi:hypothetical protein [uncultured Treponema sp.]|uniref:hypothetical protein n=1 Tax=uncultured Treponema sp. TaxID=162155 RepID=UPI00258FDBFA|nr:hypothetical protein [uncultured Treponema sp.]
MKFIRKNILTAVFFSVFAILLGGALISCSNGSSSSDEDDDESSYGTKIYSESVTFSETPTQIVSAETLADLSIKSLTIKVINVNYSGSDVWWFTAIPGSDAWNNEAKLEWQSGEGANSLYLATITDAAAIAAYKANGIYIAGTNSATAAVSVFYVEGEAEESGDSGSEKTLSNQNITFTSDRIEVVSSEKFSSIENITSIKVTNLSATDCWITLYATNASDDWNTGKYEMKGTDWSTTEATYEITEAETIKTYKNGGIYIQGTSDVTCTVTVSYE